MNILLIGSGGREHAIAYALKNSKSCDKIYATPSNPGINQIAEQSNINISNFKEIANYCKINNIELVVIGPEKPLAEGITDYLVANNINVFGPLKYAAQLESSKDFAKNLMKKYNIPTASYKTFSYKEFDDAHRYIDLHTLPIVIKADGLAAGKGVIIADTHKEAHKTIDNIFDGKFGEAGKKIVIEEFLRGEEASVFAICDGQDYVTLAPAQDHKRIGEGDTGLNTGGMGSYAPAPIVNETVLNKVKSEIIEPVLKAMNDENSPFIGCLYCGLMIENNQPKVVEFNVRFGDPEIQSVLSLFDGDFAKLLFSASIGKIDKSSIKETEKGYAACVVLASEGYPESYNKEYVIKGLNSDFDDEVNIFHAGTKEDNDNLITSGGRVLGITAKADSFDCAFDKVYNSIAKIKFENKYFRKDIGYRVRK